ncbi:MAG: TetR/AcrR family transcriptional regulator [Synergistaceae bacterium]|jgi:AcrR family transcriptional regulator|nr:TetR/AcrR family transcriptional regulator [Synergistaceae bacterium]MDD3077128.1 helix-turn-helix domain containing protein [Proteiniphilum sp.]MDD3956946.1 helix-turn-helix domain containing protein [Proteiniphilum sp.]
MSDIEAKEVKNIIVESATLFFSKYGFYKTTMDEIAQHIHKAKGGIYYYFKSKEELFNEVLKQELSNVKAELRQVTGRNIDPLTALKEYMLLRLELLNNSLNYHETLKADFFDKYKFVKDVRNDFHLFERNQITFILEKGMREGYLNVTNVNSTVDVIMMIANSIEIPLFLQNRYKEYENTINELISLITNSLSSNKK